MDQLEEPVLLVARRNVLREYIFFWTAAVFFCLPAIVEAVLVSRFARTMLTGSLGKARMTTTDIRSLWHEVLQRVEAAAESPSKLDGLSAANRDEQRSRCVNYAQLRIGSNGGGLRRGGFGLNLNSLRKRRIIVSDSKAKHREPHRATVEALELGTTDCGHIALTANLQATADGDDALVRGAFLPWPLISLVRVCSRFRTAMVAFDLQSRLLLLLRMQVWLRQEHMRCLVDLIYERVSSSMLRRLCFLPALRVGWVGLRF